MDTIAAGEVQAQDLAAPQELEHALPQQAASLATSIRQLAAKKVDEVVQRIHATMAETQQTFDVALQEHRFTDAAYAVEHLRQELDEAKLDGVGQ